jgi:two-component system nitrogen regulation sensor histidine kinase NtrY
MAGAENTSTQPAPPGGELKRKKRRLERLAIIIAVLVVVGLTVLQTQVVRLGAGVPKSHSILIFALININILLLFVLLVLVLRNLYKIFFEEHQVLRGQLRTKLVVAFVSLSLVPTILLFYSGIQFIATGHDYWFDKNVEQSLVDSLVLAQFLSDVNERFTHDFGDTIKNGIIKEKMYRPERMAQLERFLVEKRRDYHLSMVELYSPRRELVTAVRAPELKEETEAPLPVHLFDEARTQLRPRSWIQGGESRDLIRVVWPILPEGGVLEGFLVVGYQTAAPIKEKMTAVASGLEAYRELKRIHDPIRVSHYIALTIVALLSLFMSTWIGFHLAKNITGPIMELAAGTEKIASGDYDFTIDIQSRESETQTLVDSFNRMTRDLKAGKAELTQKNLELLESNRELDQRRRYMEIILQNVAAGVISTDSNGLITTINDSAEEILRIKAHEALGRPFSEVMPADCQALQGMIDAAWTSRKGSVERQVQIKIGDKTVSLHVHLSKLENEERQEMGLVVVFDDMSDLEKAQRMAAWREVARRIAHEIKNPLTPIQLSAQRLRKRYGERLAGDGPLFEECTAMIIRQVEELKRLVSEFSNFARMPEVNPSPNNLAKIVEDTLVFYEGHTNVVFDFRSDPEVPVFNLDREQMTRVLINLLDNAVAAVEDQGRIEIVLTFNRLLKMVRLEIADNGLGISPQDRSRMFEPYFSTKKSGTGLGLAIVSTIVADHDGFVRVQDNQPRGTRFVIELPVRN